MEPISPEEIQSSQKYSLTRKDFNTQPDFPVPYKFPERVTRASFTDWFIQSFAISRGQPEIQALWMRYCSLQTGFQVPSSLLAFEWAGGVEGLSKAEGQKFREAFMRVKAHGEENINLDIDFSSAFDDILEAYKSSQRNIPALKSMNPDEFLTNLRKRTGENWKKVSNQDKDSNKDLSGV